MEESQAKNQSGVLGIASLVLAIAAGAWSAIGATYPGALVGLVAAALGFIARRKAGATGTPRIVATLGLILGLLVLVASIVLTGLDKSA
jgi:NAD/NADP transhydrogenase beta subunit